MNTLDKALLKIIKGNLDSDSCYNASHLLANDAKITQKDYNWFLVSKKQYYCDNTLFMFDLFADYNLKPTIDHFIYVLKKIDIHALNYKITGYEFCSTAHLKNSKIDTKACIEFIKLMISKYNILENNKITTSNRKEIIELSAVKLPKDLFKLVLDKLKNDIECDDNMVVEVNNNGSCIHKIISLFKKNKNE